MHPNPLAWIAARRMRIEQERACDDLVLADGAKPSDYANELLRMAVRRTGPGWMPTIGMARRATMERRLAVLLDAARNRCAVRARWWIWGCLSTLLVAAPLAAVKLAEPPGQDEPASQLSEANEQSLTWGPVFARMLVSGTEDIAGAQLWLDTGDYIALGAFRLSSDPEGPTGSQIIAGTAIGEEPRTWLYYGKHLAVVRTDREGWSATPEHALEAMLHAPTAEEFRLAPGERLVTWYIRTHVGNVGVLTLARSPSGFAELSDLVPDQELDAPDEKDAANCLYTYWRFVQGPTPSPTSRLQFRLVSDDEDQPAELLPDPADSSDGKKLRVLNHVLLDEKSVAGARPVVGAAYGQPFVEVELTPWGAAQNSGITGRNLNRQLAVVLDGRVLTAPVIKDRITGARILISGDFGERETQQIAEALNEAAGKAPELIEAKATTELSVKPDGTGAYRSIQAAINAAPDGATIDIAAGDYAEHLVVTKPLTLRGTGWDSAVVRPGKVSPLSTDELQRQTAARMRLATSDAERRELEVKLRDEMGQPVLTIRDATNVVIIGIKFTALSPKGQSLAPSVVAVRRAEVTLSDCAILGGPRDGLHAVDAADVRLRRCLVAAVWGTGLHLGDHDLPAISASITRSDIRNCHYAGIRVARGRHAVEVDSCRVSGAAWHGIRYDDTSPHISGNLIFGNARSGIYASGTTEASVRGNLFHRNEMNGVSCWFDNQDRIEQNTFVNNLREGLAVLGGSAPRINHNIFSGEKIALFQGRIGGQSAAATNLVTLRLEGNLFWNNDTNLVATVPDAPRSQPEPIKLSAETESRFVDPGFVDAGNRDFSLLPAAPALEAGIGARQVLEFASPWPLQPEEEAIIPDTDTRDSRAWKKP